MENSIIGTVSSAFITADFVQTLCGVQTFLGISIRTFDKLIFSSAGILYPLFQNIPVEGQNRKITVELNFRLDGNRYGNAVFKTQLA